MTGSAPFQPEKAYQFALQSAYDALRRGQKRSARRWAEQAAALDPHREEPWLILASVASPEASIRYLEEALRIHPQSPRARKGMHWAIQRLRAQGQQVQTGAGAPAPASAPASAPAAPPAPRQRVVQQTLQPNDPLQRRSILLPWLAAAVFVLLVAAAWIGSPALARALAAPQYAAFSIANLLRPTATVEPSPTPLPTSTFTPEPTITPLPTLTRVPTDTPEPTSTPLPTDTPTPIPTDTPVPTPVPPTEVPQAASWRPEGVGANENWIDVDLTNQLLHAYTGDTLIATFVVSTGTWATPTVTGVYQVYVKFRYADMSGPGYYLANVPYVMYFYQGYGIHGTYWHNNFGTPMSHGCVNMTIEDSGWIYDFSVIGTVVNIHY